MKFYDKELEGAVLSATIKVKTKARLNVLHEKLFYFDISNWVLEKLFNNPALEVKELYDLCRTERGKITPLVDFITDSFTTMYDFDSMVNKLWSMYYKRGLQKLASGINKSLDTHDAKAIIQSAERKLATMQKNHNMDSGSMNLARQAWLEEKENSEIYKTSISALDEIVDGIKGGRVWVVGGLPGTGKSFWGLQMTLYNVFMDRNCLFFSTELTKAENFSRLMRMQKYFFASEGKPEDALANHPNLRLYDNLVTVTDILFEARRQNRLDKVDLVVVDHIQDIDMGRAQSQFEAISKAANEFKRLAIENNIAVILLSQLNKDGGFFGASKLNQIAHCAIKLQREEDGNNAVLEVTKNRSGRRGIANIKFKTPECVFLSI
jgi:replicative DNA helicase